MTIRKFHKNNNQANRNICLIPNSAHGTNPASAQMCGMKVVVVNCDEDGNVLEPDYPVLWATTQIDPADMGVPWGQTVWVDLHE